jgi:hypothetical protein
MSKLPNTQLFPWKKYPQSGLLLYLKTFQSKQSSKKLKNAQSGHPGDRLAGREGDFKDALWPETGTCHHRHFRLQPG